MCIYFTLFLLLLWQSSSWFFYYISSSIIIWIYSCKKYLSFTCKPGAKNSYYCKDFLKMAIPYAFISTNNTFSVIFLQLITKFLIFSAQLPLSVTIGLVKCYYSFVTPHERYIYLFLLFISTPFENIHLSSISYIKLIWEKL